MKRSKFTDEQILKIVREGEAGRKVADLCRTNGITEQTYYRWKAKYGDVAVSASRQPDQRSIAGSPASPRLGAIAVWVSTAARVGWPRGPGRQPQAALSRVSRRGPPSASTPAEAAHARGACALAGAEPASRAVVDGLYSRYPRGWPRLSHAQYRRRFHAGVRRHRSRSLLAGPA